MKTRRLLISILILFMSFSIVAVNAATNDSGTTSYTVSKTALSQSTSYTRFKYDEGITVTSGKSTSQHVFVYTQSQTSNSKVVTWAMKDDSGKLKRSTVASICEDYERTHPDWKVVGAINADQYITGWGTDIGGKGQDHYYPQPYYPMIADGEGWFIITGMPSAGGSNVVSILQDGSNDPLINGSSNIRYGEIKVAGPFLYIIDEEGNRLEKFNIAKINETPLAGESALWVSYIDDNKVYPTKELTGNLFVVKGADRAYASNSIDFQYKGENAMNAFFGKGQITQVTNSASIGYGDFAIETNDENVSSKLEAGMKIMVQFELEGGYSDVESAIGYHTIHRMDDKDLTSSASYNTQKYPRALIGRTATGEIVLMAIDGKQEAKGASGATFNETNAILKEYGVVEAYQMDGGGSVTAVINKDNVFTTVNSPCDGAPRQIFSALLMVERKKPDVNLTIVDYDDSQTTFKFELSMHGCSCKKLEFVIGSTSYDITEENGELFAKLGKLRRDKEYEYKINVITEKDEIVTVMGTFKLPPLKPSLKSCTMEKIDGSKIYTIEILDKDETMVRYYFLINGKTYEPNNNVVSIPEGTGVPYLIILYDNGSGEKNITIKYPESTALRFLDDGLRMFNDFLDNME